MRRRVSIKIGRANDNDIVIPEVLASRHHATLVPTAGGTEIRDNRSINGTFVNGARVESAVLHDGDVVTIGNIDLVFADGTLARRDDTGGGHRHRRPRRARGGVDDRGEQAAAGRHLAGSAPGNADGGHRTVGGG